MSPRKVDIVTDAWIKDILRDIDTSIIYHKGINDHIVYVLKNARATIITLVETNHFMSKLLDMKPLISSVYSYLDKEGE